MAIIILALMGGNVYFGLGYRNAQKELHQSQATVETQKTNKKVLEFTDIFIKKVLQTESEIDFDTRLKMENMVRDLDDEAVLGQWQKFTESKSPAQAQKEVRNLLEVLISKM